MQTINFRAFLIGLIWAGIAALGPAVLSVIDDYQHNEFTDWHKIHRTSIGMAAIGVTGYWRKHKALLKLPPYLEEAIFDDNKMEPKA